MADDLFPEEVICNDDALDGYEVGYGKPPKNTQFQKGVSGNPSGRPKKALDFDSELFREGGSFITIIENGQPKRVTKIEGLAKLSYNKAMTGSTRDRQFVIERYQRVHELKLAEELKLTNSKKRTARDMSDDELWEIVFEGQEETPKNGK